MKNQDTTKTENTNREPMKQERPKQDFQRKNNNPTNKLSEIKYLKNI